MHLKLVLKAFRDLILVLLISFTLIIVGTFYPIVIALIAISLVFLLLWCGFYQMHKIRIEDKKFLNIINKL